MVTIIAVIINHNVWIKYTISFSVGTLITNIIKVYLISVFQHGSSNTLQDSSRKIVFLYLRKTLPNRELNSRPDLCKFFYKAPAALPSDLSHLLIKTKITTAKDNYERIF